MVALMMGSWIIPSGVRLSRKIMAVNRASMVKSLICLLCWVRVGAFFIFNSLLLPFPFGGYSAKS